MRLDWEDGEEELTPAILDELQRALQRKLPPDFVDIFLSFPGASPSRGGIRVAGANETLEWLLSADDSEGSGMLETLTRLQDQIPDGIVPFASDAFGNHFCFDYRRNPDNPVVVFWNHETDDETIVASSFTELVERLEEEPKP